VIGERCLGGEVLSLGSVCCCEDVDKVEAGMARGEVTGEVIGEVTGERTR